MYRLLLLICLANGLIPNSIIFRLLPKKISYLCDLKNEYLDDYYNLSKPIMFDMIEPVMKSLTIKKQNYTGSVHEPRQIYTKDTFLNDIKEHYKQYGAYKNKESNYTQELSKQKPQYINPNEPTLNEINKQINIQRKKGKKTNKRVTVFFVNPTQAHHMNVYNNIIAREKNATLHKFNNTNNIKKNASLPKDIFDDDYYDYFDF